jgi:hypothetical protein
MHTIPWKYGSTFGEICQKYVDSVKLHGSESVILVFDGYVSGPDTKDATHLRRTKGIFGTKVIVELLLFCLYMSVIPIKNMFIPNVDQYFQGILCINDPHRPTTSIPAIHCSGRQHLRGQSRNICI